MKTLTTTLAIFSLLFSVTTFGTNLNEDINPPLTEQKPRIDSNSNDELNEINPIFVAQKPRFK